jgi:hypothetical protein
MAQTGVNNQEEHTFSPEEIQELLDRMTQASEELELLVGRTTLHPSPEDSAQNFIEGL